MNKFCRTGKGVVIILGLIGGGCDSPTMREPEIIEEEIIEEESGTVTLVNFDSQGNKMVRFDTDGHAIDSHGGEIRRFEDTYYLYGENYVCGFEWKNAASPFCGFKVYSSTNLVEWEDRGYLFDASSPYWQARCSPAPAAADYGCFRPHVAFNPNTRRYVLWINGYGVPINFQVFESETPTGPFVERTRPDLAHNNSPPWGVNFGDQNLFVDRDGTGYLAYTDWLAGGDIVIERLDSTFLTTSGAFVKLGLQRVEAPSIFRRGDRYYLMLADPNCGYCTTGTSYMTASTPLGPWSARKKITTNSCGGQPTHVAALPAEGGGEWFLYMSDLWNMGEANQATAPQFWAPLTFDAKGEIQPVTCRRSYRVPALVTGLNPEAADHRRLQCDIGGGGLRQRAFRFTTSAAGRLHELALPLYQRGSPTAPLDVEIRSSAPNGRLLHQLQLPPEEIPWSARKLPIRMDIPVAAGDEFVIRLASSTGTGCYGFAFTEEADVVLDEVFASQDAGIRWRSDPGRIVAIEASVRGS